MATLEYSVLHCDVPSVDQLHSLQVRVRAGPSCHHLSLDFEERTPNVKGVAAESIAGNVRIVLLLCVLVAVLALTMRRLFAFRLLTGFLRRCDFVEDVGLTAYRATLELLASFLEVLRTSPSASSLSQLRPPR
jgi:hypothetical protein